MQLTTQTRIGVLCGGLSSEAEVSRRSGKACFAALQRLGYTNAVLIDVDRTIADVLKAEKIELAYLTTHGTYGEDGCIQGLLDWLGIPYTGCGVAASALTMNKHWSKAVAALAGIPMLPTKLLSTAETNPNTWTEAALGFAYPVMVKPLGEGSSYGMSKVNSADGMAQALAVAQPYGDQVLIEPFTAGKSITVGVVHTDNNAPTVTPILELRTKTEWYDLEAKYTKGLTEFILPAEIAPDVTAAIQAATLTCHHALGCHGVSRTDWIVAPDNRFYYLETNTIPGMTDVSDLPAQAGAMGIGFDALVQWILRSALTRP
jgi:D-alanine-D-alanine ligase